MKTLWFLLSLYAVTAFFNFTGCSGDANNEFKPVTEFNLDTLSFEHSMKGWELYSWPNGDGWNYSILGGTNRIKSYTEVTTNPLIVFGKDSLKMLLDKLPKNEYISWIGEGWLKQCWGGNYGNLSLPDEETINEITAYCLQIQLTLTVSN
jgi:hypothetical protein